MTRPPSFFFAWLLRYFIFSLLPEILLRNRIPRPLRIPVNLHTPPPGAVVEKFHAVDASCDRLAVLGFPRLISRVNVGHRAEGIRLAADLVLEKSMLQKSLSGARFIILRRHEHE